MDSIVDSQKTSQTNTARNLEKSCTQDASNSHNVNQRLATDGDKLQKKLTIQIQQVNIQQSTDGDEEVPADPILRSVNSNS